MARDDMARAMAASTAPGADERRDSVPLQRYGTSDEIAATNSFLASDGAAYITGQNIRVDSVITRSV